jgi:hypothetical protein
MNGEPAPPGIDTSRAAELPLVSVLGNGNRDSFVLS